MDLTNHNDHDPFTLHGDAAALNAAPSEPATPAENPQPRAPGGASPPADPFDPASLRLAADYTSQIGVKKVLTAVPCRKPNRHEFFRIHPDPQWRLETAIFEDKVQGETYLVDRNLWSELGTEIRPVCLFVAVNRQRDVFFWPVKLPGPDGRSNSWNESAVAAAKLAETQWIRLAANMRAGMYDVFAAQGELSEPEWPDTSFLELLRLCFRDRFIRDMDHPVLRSLRGEE